MINRIIKLHDPINEFLSFYKSASGRKEFKYNKTALSDLTDEKWAILKGLSYLLTCFDKATVMLSGQKYLTFVSAIPVLRKIESYLSNQFMFKFDDVAKMAKTKKLYYELYGEMEFFKRVVLNLDYARMLLLQEFQQRFTGLYDNFLWLTLLDPRFGKKSTHWKSNDELHYAEEKLILEVQELAIIALEKMSPSKDDSNKSRSEEESVDDDEDEFTFEMIAPRKSDSKKNSEDLHTSEKRLTEDDKEKHRNLVRHEVNAFLIKTQTLNDMDPLIWWKAKRLNFPNVARVARKWLSVPATSTPSERVFSICGLVDTAKRSNLLGESIQKQVFLYNNMDEVK